ncbi:MAG TPA: RNA 2',3'-cyclic phosphodiesterase [Geobacteraceae bacterium]|nr:RNA 2',3'-cyclic phosphodiesterase [Geobacteraceae bacterium]
MYRLFVAIDLPEQVKEAVTGIFNRGLAGARWVPPEQLHLTLRFIGDCAERTFEEIRGGLSAPKSAPFPLTIRGIGHFPPRGEPRVLWVGVEDSVELSTLQAKIEREIVSAGIEADKRRFSPHITIARLKDTPLARITHLEESNRQFSAAPFQVSEFYLYSSTLTREGAIHRREADYRLE